MPDVVRDHCERAFDELEEARAKVEQLRAFKEKQAQSGHAQSGKEGFFAAGSSEAGLEAIDAIIGHLSSAAKNVQQLYSELGAGLKESKGVGLGMTGNSNTNDSEEDGGVDGR